MKNQHFDGRGHRTLDFYGMWSRYCNQKRSMAVLRCLSPHRYVVVPDVELHLKNGQSDEITVHLVWPGEVKILCKKLNTRSLNALRSLYRTSGLKWNVQKGKGETIFRRRGCVIRNVSAVDYSEETTAMVV